MFALIAGVILFALKRYNIIGRKKKEDSFYMDYESGIIGDGKGHTNSKWPGDWIPEENILLFHGGKLPSGDMFPAEFDYLYGTKAIPERPKSSPGDISPNQRTQTQDCTLMNTRAEIALPGFLKMDYQNDIRAIQLLSEGGGGKIYRAELLSHALLQKHPAFVALKVVKNPGKSEDTFRNIFRQEVSIMWSLSFHENVCKLVAYSEDPHAIVMRMYDYSLQEIIQSTTMRDWLSCDVVFRFAYHVVYAMAEIHSLGIVHRDLKSANLLIDTRHVPEPLLWVLVICDFGLAKVCGEKDVKAAVFCEVNGISVRYAAPEVFQRMYLFNMKSKKNRKPGEDKTLTVVESLTEPEQVVDDQKDAINESPLENDKIEELSENAPDNTTTMDEKKSDVYAFAIILWEMLSRQSSWPNMKNEEIGKDDFYIRHQSSSVLEWNVRNGARPAMYHLEVQAENDDPSQAPKYQLLFDCIRSGWQQENIR